MTKRELEVRDWNTALSAGGKWRREGYCFCVLLSIHTPRRKEGRMSNQKGTERVNFRLLLNQRRGQLVGQLPSML